MANIEYVLEQGLDTLKLAGSLDFYDALENHVGGIRYNTTNDTVEVSVDGGVTWKAITTDTFWWSADKAYTTGTVVLHTSGWYVCDIATDSEVPGTSASWRLLTSGTMFRYVSNASQLKEALETDADSISIKTKGIIGPLSAAITASTVTIWSDETTALNGNISISTGANSSIYWHSQGTTISKTLSISCTGGSLYIDRMRITTGTTTLSDNITYQYITGTVSGGVQDLWTIPEIDAYVPKDLSKLDVAEYKDSFKVYVNEGSSYGYVTIATIAEEIANEAVAYFNIDRQDVLANKPDIAARGYVFYATDTGDIYIMQADNQWSDAIRIRGEAGYTYIPQVIDGVLSWTASNEVVNPAIPEPVRIEGPRGFGYGSPEPYSPIVEYVPPTAANPYYPVVTHQGGSWVYIALLSSTGNTPPTLPETSNAYWSLLAAPGEDTGSGISVQKFELRRPVSRLGLHLQIKVSNTPKLADAALLLDTLNSETDRSLVVAWHEPSNTWTTISENGLTAVYDNALVAVDLGVIKTTKYIFYRWVSSSTSETEWKASTFPNSYAMDTSYGSLNGYIDFTDADVSDTGKMVINPASFVVAVISDMGVQYILGSDSVSYDIPNNKTTIDLSDIITELGISTLAGTWKLVTNGCIPDSVLQGDHTHHNKPALDLVTIDTTGNIMLGGVIVVTSTTRDDTLYLIDPEFYAASTSSVDPDEYSLDTTNIDPGTYSALKVAQMLNNDVYNNLMNINTAGAYNTNETVIVPGEIEE